MNLPVRRTRENAVVAGVCAGLAHRWNIDPKLLRIGIVLACLASGLGFVLYGVGVLVLPAEGTVERPIHRFLPFTRNWPLPGLVLALGATGFVLVGAVGGWSGVGFVPVLLALGIWYVASRRRNSAQTVTAEPTPFERAAVAWRDRLVAHQVNSGALPPAALATVVTQPPTSPAQADAATDVVPVRRRGPARLWWLALGLSAVGMAAVALTNGQFAGAGALPYLAVILASLGITLLVATRSGRPRLMGFVTVVVLLLTLGAWVAPTTEKVRMGDFRVADETRSFVTASELPDNISASAGDLELDFSNLTLTNDTSLKISLGVGDVDLRLPDNVNSEVTWDVGLGDVEVQGSPKDSGTNLSGSTANHVVPGAPTLHITVALRFGSLGVTT